MVTALTLQIAHFVLYGIKSSYFFLSQSNIRTQKLLFLWFSADQTNRLHILIQKSSDVYTMPMWNKYHFTLPISCRALSNPKCCTVSLHLTLLKHSCEGRYCPAFSFLRSLLGYFCVLVMCCLVTRSIYVIRKIMAISFCHSTTSLTSFMPPPDNNKKKKL